ncbi:MAG: 1,4-alpha-glucan branching protein GlgB [Actinobacteria bacterium]|nr:1,4-alpha-glucan branching protein GlgB [Actinomycetota bacterium]
MARTSKATVPPDIERLLAGAHHDPHAILGAHSDSKWVTIRTLRPGADSVTLVLPDDVIAMEREVGDLWVARVSGTVVPDYHFDVPYGPEVHSAHDPYRFLPVLGEIDLHLISEGRHEEIWTKLGAHPQTLDGISGTSFAVWAPNARGVRVVGDFDHWDGRAFPMRSLGASGVWELFLPDVGVGTRYKYRILGDDGVWRDKADPYALAAETPPATASVVFASGYTWSDREWMLARAQRDPHRGPMTIYEVHLGSWRPGLDYRDLARELVEYVTDLGFTHVEFLPVAEHPYGPSWGYQVSGYYAPTARFGSPDDLRFLIDALHRAGIGVLIDWVPAHFPKDEWALARFDGTCLFEHPDPRRGEHPDWGTYVFDFGRPEVRNFLVANAVYWLEEFHVDGLRVDAVASMLYLDYSRREGEWAPNVHGGRENLDAVRFLQEMNATVYRRVPGAVTIAEESTAWAGVTAPTDVGGLGFGFKWNMGWMHDSLGYMRREAIHRVHHHNEMTFSMMYAYSEQFVLPFSHDEVVHGKGSLVTRMPGDRWQALANLRAYLAYMWAHPGKKLLFMGSEFAQSAEWSSERGLDWELTRYPEHLGIQRLVSDLNSVYRDSPALWAWDDDPSGFQWLDPDNSAENVFTWLRWGPVGDCIAVAVNLSPVPRLQHSLALPTPGTWREVLNSDASIYGGTDTGNLGAIHALPDAGGRPRATVVLPPLAACYFHGPT